MIRYIFKRILLVIPTIILIFIINFYIVKNTPGNIYDKILSSDQAIESNIVSKDIYIKIKKYSKFDFNHGIIQTIRQIIAFDFGYSYFKNQKVSKIIFDKIKLSILITMISVILMHTIAIPIGIITAMKRGSIFNFLVSTVTTTAYSTPIFITSVLLAIIFYKFNKIIDLNLINIFIAIATISIVGIAKIIMITKNSCIIEMSKQYVLTAKSKGCSNFKIFYSHVFKNVMLIILSNMPYCINNIFLNTILIVEILFSIDGIGKLAFDAIVNRDYPLIFFACSNVQFSFIIYPN